MSNRTKAILLFGIGGILLLILIFFFVSQLRSDKALPVENVSVEEADSIGTLPVAENFLQVAQVDEESGSGAVLGEGTLETELTRLAVSFTERFGSYSSESDFENIRDLQVLMTDEMKAWSQTYISDLQSRYEKSPEYYGVSTRGISVKTNALDAEAGKADFTVITQRSETIGTKAPLVKYQNFHIKMALVGSQWKVGFGAWE